jgi:hypothetical protein
VKEIINEKYKYSELTGRIIAFSIEVHKILSTGFKNLFTSGHWKRAFYCKVFPQKGNM